MKPFLPINKDDLPQQQVKKVSRIEYIGKICLLLFVFAASFGTLFLFLQNRRQSLKNSESDDVMPSQDLVPYDETDTVNTKIATVDLSSNQAIVRRLQQEPQLEQDKVQNMGNGSQPLTPMTDVVQITNGGKDVRLCEIEQEDSTLLYVFYRSDQRIIYGQPLTRGLTNNGAVLAIKTMASNASNIKAKPRPGGGLDLMWQEDENIYFQAFSVSGQQLIAPKPVNSYAIVGDAALDFHFPSGGSGAAVWSNSEYTPIGHGMHSQKLTQTGDRVGVEFLSSDGNNDFYSGPNSVFVRENGESLYTWRYSRNALSSRSYLSNGTVLSSDMKILGCDRCYLYCITHAQSRSVMIYAYSVDSTYDASIYVRPLDETGKFLDEIDIGGGVYTTTTGIAYAITTTSSGNFVPGWVTPGAGNFVYTQYLSPELAKLGDVTSVVTSYATRPDLYIGSLSYNNLLFGWSNTYNDTITEQEVARWIADGLAPISTKAVIDIPYPGAEFDLTGDNFAGVDPDGPKEALDYSLFGTHSTIIDQQTNQTTTDLIQGGVDERRYRFKHDGSHYQSEVIIDKLTDASGVSIGPIKVAVTLHDLNYAPTVNAEKKPTNIAIYPWRHTAYDCSEVFSVRAGDVFSAALKSTNGKPLSDQIKFVFNNSACQIDYWPTDQFVTTPLELVGTSVREDGEVGESLSTSVFYSAVRTAEPIPQTEDNGPSGWDKAKVIVPPLFSALGALTTISCCLCSASLAAAVRQHGKQRVIQHSRDFDEFAKLVFNALGQPNSVKDFTTSEGRKFIAIVTGHIEATNQFHIPYASRNILTAIGIVEMPTAKKEQRKLARKVAEAIKAGIRPMTGIVGTFKHPKLTVALIEQNFDRIIAVYGKNPVVFDVEMVAVEQVVVDGEYVPPLSYSSNGSGEGSGDPLLDNSSHLSDSVEVFDGTDSQLNVLRIT